MSNIKKVPFVDMARNISPHLEALQQAASDVISSGYFIGGPNVQGFEKEMAAWLGVNDVCGVSCATSGLYAAVRGLGIGPSDEVITTVHTAIPTSEAITMAGANVVFCDIGPAPGSFNIDPSKVEALITEKTKAIISVHLYGHPTDLDAIIDIAKRHNLKIIEDCAQAQGAKYKNQYVGTFGDVAVFSFFPSKNLGGFGDGGALTAKDPNVMKQIQMISNHGRTKKYHHEIEGINSRLDAIQAAMLRIVLPKLDAWNDARNQVASWYREQLADIDGLQLPTEANNCKHIYHVFVVVVDDRDDFGTYLHEQGVNTGVHYPYALNMQPAYAHLGQGKGSFPVAEYACKHMLSLPMFPTITREEVDYVCTIVRGYFT